MMRDKPELLLKTISSLLAAGTVIALICWKLHLNANPPPVGECPNEGWVPGNTACGGQNDPIDITMCSQNDGSKPACATTKIYWFNAMNIVKGTVPGKYLDTPYPPNPLELPCASYHYCKYDDMLRKCNTDFDWEGLEDPPQILNQRMFDCIPLASQN